jgi:hypothetical protein
MMKKRLLAVQGPQQFIAGFIAMEWYKQSNADSQQYETVLLMYDFLMPESSEAEFVDVIVKLAEVEHFDKTIFISGAEMRKLMAGRYANSKQTLRALIGEEEFDEIHIGRDFCGEGSPLILNAYPNSTRLLYGDAFGLVGNEAEFDNFNWRAPIRGAASACKKFLKDAVYGTHEKLNFHAAVLTLPLDWSGNYLNKLPLIVPDRGFVISTIGRFARHLDELNDYIDTLLDVKENNYLFLLSNLSASGYMSEADEIEMYYQTISALVPADACLFLKAHPRAPQSVLNSLMARLGNGHGKVKVIDDVKLSRLPVELWVKLLQSCTIVPIFSTSAINLKYFYDQGVVMPLSEAGMTKYCYADKLPSFVKVYRAIAESVENLDTWDRKYPLWKG